MLAAKLPPRTTTLTCSALACAGLLSACAQGASSSQGGAGSSPAAATSQAAASAAAPASWIDQPVSFQAGGVTVYATYRHPAASPARAMPAVLLIAGSRPTDRNGNSKGVSGSFGTLQTLAGWLSADGVASLRYDKLGSGQTGLGPFTSKPDSIGIAPFEQEAAAALRFLAQQPGVNPGQLGVIGHSEGALFALLLANGLTGGTGAAPHVHALGLLEPLSERYLDIIAVQIAAQVAAAQRAGQLTAAQAASLTSSLTAAIKQLRSAGTVPSGLPAALSSVLSPATALYLSQADRYDPAGLAAQLPDGTPVLVSCSNADIQVTCAEVQHLRAGLAQAAAKTDFVSLNGVDHVLKQDPTGSAASYTKPLPFSPQLQQALRSFVQQNR
jgi:pimeloyl-ACP methyl ester carboxylesterase